MIRKICKDEKFLAIVSEEASKNDTNIGQDLLDTLEYHKDKCVGMAANMISFLKELLYFLMKEKKKSCIILSLLKLLANHILLKKDVYL